MELSREQKQRFVSDVVETIAAQPALTGLDRDSVEVEAYRMAAEVGPALAMVSEGTAAGEVFVPRRDADGNVEVLQVRFADVAWEVAGAVAVGALMTVFTGPVIGVAAAAGAGLHSGTQKSLTWLLGKKVSTLGGRDGAMLGALIALQFDCEGNRREGVYPTIPELRDTANLILAKRPLLRFESDKDVAIKLDEFSNLKLVQQHGERWNLNDWVWMSDYTLFSEK